jgi:hypothetical protein
VCRLGLFAPKPNALASSDKADAPRDLYTAIQQHLGLKIDATRRAESKFWKGDLSEIITKTRCSILMIPSYWRQYGAGGLGRARAPSRLQPILLFVPVSRLRGGGVRGFR